MKVKTTTLNKSIFKKLFIACLSTLIVATQIQPIQALDTWPFEGEHAPKQNEPSVRGYTSGRVLDFDPETDPNSKYLRSFVPLQKRIEPLADTQANPDLDPKIEMFNLTGDYGNAFFDNPPYSDKFAQYHFNFWQYTDYFAGWHGMVSPHISRDIYDKDVATQWWTRNFEFGMLNIPISSYTDAAHRNGVMSIATIFHSRGLENYRSMIVRDEEGNFPVADKLIELAKYYGFDGYFINQEEPRDRGYNIHPDDLATYKEFIVTLREAGLYINWYDSLNTKTGYNAFPTEINDVNIDMLHDRLTNKQINNSFFINYHMTPERIARTINYIDNFNAEYGTNYDVREVAMAGIEAGKYRWDNGKINPPGEPGDENEYASLGISLASLGAEFVAMGLEEDMKIDGNAMYPNNYRNHNDYQWMIHERERIWWTSQTQDPTDTTTKQDNSDVAVASDNHWNGVAHQIAERSVIGDTTFYTDFNTGHGLQYYKDGELNHDVEWSNMSLQNIPVTWQWWEETQGQGLDYDFDYGEGYEIGERFNYTPVGGYNGGSSLVASGTLDDDVYLRLFKSDIDVDDSTKFEMKWKKQHTGNDRLVLGLIFEDSPKTVETIELTTTNDIGVWNHAEADLSNFSGRKIATIGLKMVKGSESVIENYQLNIGNILITNDQVTTPNKPSGLKITESFNASQELMLEWDREENFDVVDSYNIYVNDKMVGGKYDSNFYIKNMPSDQGTIKVVPVGKDGLEGEAATLEFNLNDIGIRDERYTVNSDGTILLEWNTEKSGQKLNVTVEEKHVKSSEKFVKTIQVSSDEKQVLLNELPTNGHDMIIRISNDTGQTTSLGGKFQDLEADQYKEDYSWSGKKVFLYIPNDLYWDKMYVVEDGVYRKAPARANITPSENGPYIKRGSDSLQMDLIFQSDADQIEIIMEYMNGNKSEPLLLERDVAPEVLKEKVSNLKLLDKNLYTKSSYKNFEVALLEAEKVANNTYSYRKSLRDANKNLDGREQDLVLRITDEVIESNKEIIRDLLENTINMDMLVEEDRLAIEALLSDMSEVESNKENTPLTDYLDLVEEIKQTIKDARSITDDNRIKNVMFIAKELLQTQDYSESSKTMIQASITALTEALQFDDQGLITDTYTRLYEEIITTMSVDSIGGIDNVLGYLEKLEQYNYDYAAWKNVQDIVNTINENKDSYDTDKSKADTDLTLLVNSMMNLKQSNSRKLLNQEIKNSKLLIDQQELYTPESVVSLQEQIKASEKAISSDNEEQYQSALKELQITMNKMIKRANIDKLNKLIMEAKTIIHSESNLKEVSIEAIQKIIVEAEKVILNLNTTQELVDETLKQVELVLNQREYKDDSVPKEETGNGENPETEKDSGIEKDPNNDSTEKTDSNQTNKKSDTKETNIQNPQREGELPATGISKNPMVYISSALIICLGVYFIGRKKFCKR